MAENMSMSSFALSAALILMGSREPYFRCTRMGIQRTISRIMNNEKRNMFMDMDECVHMNSRFAKFDNERGSLRLLHILGNRTPPMSRTTFLEIAVMMGVGKSAFYSSKNTLVELGLIEEKWIKIAGVSVKGTELTSKGEFIAKKISELASDLSNG